MLDRIMGVLRLDVNTFEEVEADQNATSQAAMIVVLVAILTGIGTGLLGDNFVMGFISAALGALLGWLVWAALTYFIGTNFFGGQADLGEMLRVIGFAQVPNALAVLGFISVLGPIISFVASIWALVAAFIGVRQGLDIDNVKTAITVVIGWLVVFIGTLLITGLMAGVGFLAGAVAG